MLSYDEVWAEFGNVKPAILNSSSEPAILNSGSEAARFEHEAFEAAREMAGKSSSELAELLKCSDEIATLTHARYCDFENNRIPAALAYNGVAFKHLGAWEWSASEVRSAKDHLMIFSFLYGLLRPCDGIAPYRMEGKVKLAVHGGKSMFVFWKPLLTAVIAESVNSDDGVLLWCASEEMKTMVDWKSLMSLCRIIEPEFLVEKEGKLKPFSVFSKTCRGAMARMTSTGALGLEQLTDFSYKGFKYDSSYCASDGHEVLRYICR